MCSLCRLSVAKNQNFRQILTFGGLLYQPPFTEKGQIWCATATHGLRLRAKFRLDRFILLPSGGEKPKIFRLFGLQHIVVSPVGGSLRKLNTGVHNYKPSRTMVSKSFLYSNAVMAKSGAQTLSFKSVPEEQTQTDKKLNVLGHPGGG